MALAWAEKVIVSKPPRYTDASRGAARFILSAAQTQAELVEALRGIEAAAFAHAGFRNTSTMDAALEAARALLARIDGEQA
jgi:hypothetical protein